MADYSVSIKLAIAGAKELDRVNKQTERLRTSINAVNKTAESSGKKPVKNFNNLSKSVREAREALNEAAIGTKEFNQAVKNLITVENKFNRAQKNKNRALKVEAIRRKEGLTLVQAKIKISKQELELENKLAIAKARTARKERNKRIGGTISSAAIGGAFPLLFGQTGAAAVGGGIGGAAGGLIGGQFGFALSILGTALGSAIDKNEKFNKSLAALNVQFSTTSGGTQILAADVDRLAKRLSITKEEAISALGAFKEFGSGSVAKSLVSIFGTDSGALDTLASTNRQAVLAQQIFDTRKQIGNQVAKQLLQQNLVNDQSTIELALAEAKAKAANDEAIAKAKVITFIDRLKASEDALTGQQGGAARFGEARAKKIQEDFDKNRNKRLEDFANSLREVRELLGLVNEANGQFGESGVLAFSAITDKVKDLQDEMKRLQNPISQALSLSESMARSFEDSFVGIIKGTMSVGDAFRNMLNSMADHFIKTAARMAANQFQQGILGLLGGALGGGRTGTSAITGLFGGGFMQGPQGGFFNPVTGKGISGPNFGLADGGIAKAGRTHLVGERGPELFTPGVTGTVTPNHALGGSTNIVVNVDASGSSVEGDEERGREFGEQLVSAVQAVIINERRSGGLLN